MDLRPWTCAVGWVDCLCRIRAGGGSHWTCRALILVSLSRGAMHGRLYDLGVALLLSDLSSSGLLFFMEECNQASQGF